MKILKALDKNTIMLEIGDGAIVTVHSHRDGECEIQFGGVEGELTITSPPFTNDGFKSRAISPMFVRYELRKKSDQPLDS